MFPSDRGTYHYVMLPSDIAEVLSEAPLLRGGFGSIKCKAAIGATQWATSVFPDKGDYLLLVAKRVLLAEGLSAGDEAEVTLTDFQFL